MPGHAVWVPGAAAVAAWAAVLGAGATSGGTNPTLSNGDDLAVAVNLGSDIGAAAAMFQRAFVSHRISGVLVIGDASGALDDETIVNADCNLAARTLTLPGAATGWWYIIHTTNTGGGAGTISLDDQAGDTINDGAGPIVLQPAFAAGTRLWFAYAENATNWVVQQIA